MSSWGNNDNAANAPYWAVNSTIVNATNVKANYAAPTADNVARLYANTTADVYTVGETIGLFMVDSNEQQVQQSNGTPPTHTGWNLKTTGSGGRAGRVTWETLVAQSQILSDNNTDDTVLPDTIITITSQPATLRGPVDQASAQTTTFSVTAAVTSGAVVPLTYQWQVNNNSGGVWVNIDPGTDVTTGQPSQMTKTGANTATLTLDPTGTASNNFVFRCVVSNADAGATATSANGRILIV
jgi:hypothetical protein